jgi:hypothetical protein
VEDRGGGEEVRPGVDGLASGLLGRHERELALHRPAPLGVGAAGGGRVGDAEVRQFDLARAAEQDVVRRDVAVHEAHRRAVRGPQRVDVAERVEEGVDDREGDPGREASALRAAQQRGEVAALHELHGEEVVLAGAAELVDLHHVGVAQLRGHAGLVDEAPHRLGVEREAGVDALDHQLAGDPFGAHELGAEHLRHPTGADASEQPIALREP